MQKNKGQAVLGTGSPCLAIWQQNLEHRASEHSNLNYFGTQALRRIIGYRWDNFVSNDRLLCERGMRLVTCMIQESQLRIFGQVERFPKSNPVGRVISEEISPASRRTRGRPGGRELMVIAGSWDW